MKQAICLGLALLLIGAGAFSCENPLFMSGVFDDVNAKPPTFRETPEDQADDFFCPQFTGKKSCCSAESLRSMQATLEKYSDQLEKRLNSLVDEAGKKCDQLDVLSSTARATRMRTYRAKLVDQLADAANLCMDESINFASAMLCMGCRPHSQEYVENDNILVEKRDVATHHAACSNLLKVYLQLEMTLSKQQRLLTKRSILRFSRPACHFNNKQCIQQRVESASSRMFFDVDELLGNNLDFDPAITFIEEGGYLAFSSSRATTTTTTTTASNGTGTNTTTKTNTTGGSNVSLTACVGTNCTKSATALAFTAIPLIAVGLAILN